MPGDRHRAARHSCRQERHAHHEEAGDRGDVVVHGFDAIPDHEGHALRCDGGI